VPSECPPLREYRRPVGFFQKVGLRSPAGAEGWSRLRTTEMFCQAGDFLGSDDPYLVRVYAVVMVSQDDTQAALADRQSGSQVDGLVDDVPVPVFEASG
jgi:hypothetical protein